jgi:hypothetical protein
MITRRLTEIVERHPLLPATHMGERKGVSTYHALHWLRGKINSEHNGKAERRTVSILSLGVSRAYDNVSHPRLIHSLKKRKDRTPGGRMGCKFPPKLGNNKE